MEYITSASRIQVDRTGDTSSTNMQAIFQRMDEFVPQVKRLLKDKSVSKVNAESVKAFLAANTFDEKLNMLRENRDLGNQFIDNQRTGGPKDLAFALIQNNPATQQIRREAEEAVLPFKEAGVVFRDATVQIRVAVPNLIAATMNEAGLEQARTDDKSKPLATARATWVPSGTPRPMGRHGVI